MAAIFVASSIPNLGPLPADVSDKTAHLGAYAVLAMLLMRAMSGARWDGCTGIAAVTAWGLASAYGLTDEWHQLFVPGRMPSIGDIVADTTGAAIGVIAVLGFARVRLVRGREV